MTRGKHTAPFRNPEKELSAIYENVPGIVFYIAVEPDGEFRFLSVSRDFLTATGLSREQVVGSLVRDVIPPPSRDMVLNHYREAIRSGQSVRWEEKSLYPTGEKYGEVAVTPLYDASGLATHLIGIVHDITERKRTEVAARQQASLLRLSFDAIFVWRFEGGIESWNRGAETLYGFTESEVIGRRSHDLLKTVFPVSCSETEKVLKDIGKWEGELRHRTKDNREVIVSARLQCIRGDEGIVRVLEINRDITERKRLEEKRAEDLLEAAPDAMVAVDQAGRMILANAQTERLFGYRREEILGHPVEILIPERFRQRHRGHRGKFSVEPRVRSMGAGLELFGLHRDGTEFPVEVSLSPVEAEEGTLVVGAIRDISERKIAEESRKLAEDRERRVLETLDLVTRQMSAAVTHCSRDFRYLWANQAYADWIQRPLNEVVGHSIPDVLGKDAFEALLPHFNRVLTGENVHYERETSFRGIGRRWTLSTYTPTHDANGATDGWVAVVLDTTERKQAEEARLRLAAIVESSDDGISSVGLDGVTLTWNAGAQRMFGYTENEMVGKPASIIVPPELRDQQKKILETLSAGGRIEQFETVRVSKTGKRIDVSLSISPIKDSTGKIVGCAGTARDITSRKRAEEALLSSEQRYRLLFERNVAGVGIGSLEGRVLDCNDGWAHILGYKSKDEVIGRHASEIYLNLSERQTILDELREKQVVFSRELRLKRKDGSPVWVLFNAAALNMEHGAPILQATMIDISEWKRAEEALSGMTRKLIESQEQERTRIGRELHDDINQRLAMLGVELGQLLENPSEVQNRVQELRKQATELSNDVQALSHDLHSSKLEYLGVVAGMKSWCKEFAERQKIDLDCKTAVSSPLPPEIGLPLFRVLQEALTNATKHSGVKRVEVQLRERSGEIHLVIADSGRGFDIEAAKQGRGLGLTSMQERVRLVNGTISIESKPMGGTTIHVRVPLGSTQDAERAAG